MRNSDPLGDLERHLARLSSRGELRRTTVVFGVTTDPFHPFDEKFATSMRFLQLFERYVPGKLIIQTRSPLIVIGLPVLKQVRENTSVVVAIETPLDEIRRRYTPDLPSVSERWKTVRALKSFGFKVGVQVAPILPYGDWREGGVGFAEELASSADFVVLGCVADTASAGRAPAGELARRLTAERQFFWLRRDTARPLHEALVRMAPEKVYHPASVEIPDRQLVLFGG
jgi:DNA repair photolyase